MAYKTVTRAVLSYCSIPEEISNTDRRLMEGTSDTFIEMRVIPKVEQPKYDDDFTLDNWIISEHPELEGRTILIELDY